MPYVFYNARVVTPRQEIENGAVVVSETGQIAYVGPMDGRPTVDGAQVDLQGRILAPGLIDVHVHGGKGITFGNLDRLEEEIRFYSEWVASTGVAGFVCSVAAPNTETLLRIVDCYATIFERGLPGAEALGLHLEGPYLNPERKGAFNPAWLHLPTLQEAEALLQAGRGWIRQVTLAPELPGALETAARFRAAGVVVALGHSNADYETAWQALQGDFRHVTHTYNAQRGFQHREPGVVGAVLTSEGTTAELIADLVHVHPGAMRLLVRCLGRDRVVLVTDAMAGAGLADGQYELVGHPVTVKNGMATLADGTLAGSTVLLNQCVRNMHLEVGVPLREAVQMASLNPARAMGLDSRLGSLEVGKDASLVVLDDQARVYLTVVRGKIVYRSD